jgi:peptidoglycan/xylan/chitin deacetylase (PgdA/CDA1 family)
MSRSMDTTHQDHPAMRTLLPLLGLIWSLGHLAAEEPVVLKANLRFPAAGAERVFALTIDDGPFPTGAPVLMEAMAKVGWKATFCVMGQFVDAHPDIAKRMVAEGHEVASHSYSHPYFDKLTPEQIDDQLTRTHAAILKATGVAPIYFRAPGCNLSPEQTTRINQTYGYRILGVSFDSRDWAKPPAGEVTKRMLEGGIANGDIVLVHEVFPQSMKELPDIIAALAAKGYRSVTISRLIALKAGAPAPAAK